MVEEAEGVKDEISGKCVICGVIGQGDKDFVCEKCGSPDKIMLVCKCGQRNDITPLHGRMNDFLPFVICWRGDERDEKDITPGTTIFVQACPFCKGREEALRKEYGRDIKIYRIRG